ncbi:hypothetical protein FRACYDRAFT_223152 [Fragilariopsis cylindrus CCMP1102]|uniref:Uncharacterized protein n=1 Tax=Fragilariopsis cylindrus CCMP1102 TaxID=635003 RepID=A0A1E7FUF7_9STRA|nr:hypothetical protein FRACYDRAFT_223152 [Fragilariopsis cylindrus CCMP1102]|eukprot:OEU21747.1 hypothetical protein FRACYDRAFT_223152 [Fragilariopsis cylindrus CCMP1102]
MSSSSTENDQKSTTTTAAGEDSSTRSTNNAAEGGGQQRNTEIWSTRIQRELLAMTTTDNNPLLSEDAKKVEMNAAAILPSFCIIKEHSLDIERGNCTVTCQLNLPPAAGVVVAKSEEEEDEEEVKKEDNNTESSEKEAEDEEEEGSLPSPSEEQQQQQQEKSDVDVVTPPPPPPPITITLDVSLAKNADGTSVDATAISYPFLKPIAILASGYQNFPVGSTIKDGDRVDIEMDWTPSLHLTDAILNIALKIKECLSQGEVVHPSSSASQESSIGIKSSTKAADAVGDVVNRAKKIGSSFGFSLRNFTETTTSTSNSSSSNKNNDEGGDSSKEKKMSRLTLGRKKKQPKPVRSKATSSEIRIGDEINMLEAPWVDCQGVYSCKAIRRPKFVDDAIALAVPKDSNNEEKKKDHHIIEMRSNKLNLSTGTVTFAIPIEIMAKLKFRRQESVSLFFKPAPDEPLIYMCPDSADCVHQIQAVLKRHGVKGKHTNAATHRAINQALQFVQEIQTKELALKHDPSIDRVNEIMDLYRQAAECFEKAGDVRHEEVVTHMRKFLALPLTVSVLDGSYTIPADDEPISNTTGEGVVLSSSEKKGDDTSDSVEEDKQFEENMDNLLAEAEADLANMKTDEDDPELDAMLEEHNIAGGDADDAIADFENMLKEADDELAELMSS